MLGNVCGYKLEEVTGYWRVLHTEGPHSVYCSPNIISEDSWAGNEAHRAEEKCI